MTQLIYEICFVVFVKEKVNYNICVEEEGVIQI